MRSSYVTLYFSSPFGVVDNVILESGFTQDGTQVQYWIFSSQMESQSDSVENLAFYYKVLIVLHKQRPKNERLHAEYAPSGRKCILYH
jgi:hypothetical protein